MIWAKWWWVGWSPGVSARVIRARKQCVVPRGGGVIGVRGGGLVGARCDG